MTRYQPLDQEEPQALIARIRSMAMPLISERDLDPLMTRMAKARLALLGEATHGTAEYYDWRTRISRRLIEEQNFNLIAVEGDWPDCFVINQYIKGQLGSTVTTDEALRTFRRWPTWIWANEEMADFVDWLYQFNRGRRTEDMVGFYGLDVYSLWEPLRRVTSFLRDRYPEALEAAERAIACLDAHQEDAQSYARATILVPTNCEAEVAELLAKTLEIHLKELHDDRDESFNALQNAMVSQNAEAYYRTMVQGGPASWNLRDRHMADTLDRLLTHHGNKTKVIVWEHNTHIGDARYTDMGSAGMLNVGQLVRERYGAEENVIVGFASYEGTVLAARSWGAPMERMSMPPALPGTWEAILRHAGLERALLVFGRPTCAPELMEVRGHRAIGVVYDPRYDQHGNYVPTILPMRYDALIFFSDTHALHPIYVPRRLRGEPQTYPSAH